MIPVAAVVLSNTTDDRHYTVIARTSLLFIIYSSCWNQSVTAWQPLDILHCQIVDRALSILLDKSVASDFFAVPESWKQIPNVDISKRQVV